MGRRPKRWGPPLDGLLVVDKPVGPSSMDVVRRVRRAAGGERTGHAGTLDPRASGVVVVCIGRGTRLVESLMDHDKEYEASIDLSATTTTDDAEGERCEVAVAEPPSQAAVAAALADFVGCLPQLPPAFSALKVGGVAAYTLARAGEAPVLAARLVTLHAVSLLAYHWPIAQIHLHCGRGYYVRALARDLGRALGTGGHLVALRRTRVGAYGLDRAVALDALPEQLDQGSVLPLPDPA